MECAAAARPAAHRSPSVNITGVKIMVCHGPAADDISAVTPDRRYLPHGYREFIRPSIQRVYMDIPSEGAAGGNDPHPNSSVSSQHSEREQRVKREARKQKKDVAQLQKKNKALQAGMGDNKPWVQGTAILGRNLSCLSKYTDISRAPLILSPRARLFMHARKLTSPLVLLVPLRFHRMPRSACNMKAEPPGLEVLSNINIFISISDNQEGHGSGLEKAADALQ